MESSPGMVNIQEISRVYSTSSRRKHPRDILKLLVAILLPTLLPVVRIVSAEAATAGENENSIDSIIPLSCSVRDPRMNSTYEKRYGQDVVWQIPPNPKAVLFFAHGGFKEPLSFFDQGPNCRQCYGLPEDRTIVLAALERGYAVLTIKSIDNGYDIFPPGDMFEEIETSTDLWIASNVLQEWTKEHSLESLQWAAWGHSNGGYFVAALAWKIPKIRAIVVNCNEGLIQVDEVASPLTFPPTFFAYMPRDTVTGINLKVEKAMGILRERGVKVDFKQCLPKPLSPLFFTERIWCMSDETSRKIYWAYKAAGWLDEEDYLIKFPESDDWLGVLAKANVLPLCEGYGNLCLADYVEQELQMAEAMHSMTTDADDEIFPWLHSVLFPNQGGWESV